MSMLRLYGRVLGLLGPQASLGIVARRRQCRARGRAACRARAVRPDHRRACRRASRRRRALLAATRAAGRRLGRVRPVPHRLWRACLALCRSAGASAKAGRAVGLFRARAPASAELPWRHPFGAADEGDALRHGYAVVALARLLPRAPRRARFNHGAAAALDLSQLAARAPAGRPVADLRGPHGLHPAQDPGDAEIGRALLFRPRRARLRHDRQCGAGAELHPRRGRGARLAQGDRAAARRADPGAVLVGARLNADQGFHHAHHAGHPRARPIPVRARRRPRSAASSCS